MAKINCGKSVRIIYKSHANLQTMIKTHMKFQNDRHKTVGGVALKLMDTRTHGCGQRLMPFPDFTNGGDIKTIKADECSIATMYMHTIDSMVDQHSMNAQPHSERAVNFSILEQG